MDIAGKYLDVDSGILDILKSTKRELTVHFPVKLDDGSVRVFTGYRVLHNSTLGPGKGGLRYHPHMDLDEVSETATNKNKSLRTAAYILAIGRVSKAMTLRGIYP